jgi:hypothetical protein
MTLTKLREYLKSWMLEGDGEAGETREKVN